MHLHLSKEEKLELENSQLKQQNLQMQSQIVQQNANNILSEFCKRNSKDISEIKEVNIQNGTVEFEEIDPDKKKEKSVN